MGIKQALQDEDSNLEKDSKLAYPFGLYIVDKDGKEIPDDTKIRIIKDEPSVTIAQLERSSYSDIKMRNGEATHRLEKGVEFRGGELFIIYIINSQNDIRSENVQFKMKVDLWSRDI
jgi:hypothetical protein